jgi:hypothetical protein
MDVRMVMEVLPPGMQHCDDTELGTEVLGSAAMVRSVSAAARHRMAYTTALFWSAISATDDGTMKTTWK